MIPNRKEKLRVQFDLRHCSLAEPVLDKMEENLRSLFRQVENFSLSDVHVQIEHNARINDYSVKLRLTLPGATLVGSDHGQAVHAAFERCLIGLEENIRAYKDRLDRAPQRHRRLKGTDQDLEAAPPPDPAAIDLAIHDADYTAFRSATFGYEEPVRKRVGRWIERYPEITGQIGRRLTIEDIVEEVFLRAYDEYASRPAGIRFGDWLEGLIDPAVKALREHPDEELENINLVRSARAGGRQ